MSDLLPIEKAIIIEVLQKNGTRLQHAFDPMGRRNVMERVCISPLYRLSARAVQKGHEVALELKRTTLPGRESPRYTSVSRDQSDPRERVVISQSAGNEKARDARRHTTSQCSADA